MFSILQLANAWRKAHSENLEYFATGFVLVFEGEVFGFCSELPEYEKTRLGTYAINVFQQVFFCEKDGWIFLSEESC